MNNVNDCPDWPSMLEANHESSGSLTEFVRRVLNVDDICTVVFTLKVLQHLNRHLSGLSINIPVNGRGFLKHTRVVHRMTDSRPSEYHYKCRVWGWTTLEKTFANYYNQYLYRKYNKTRLNYPTVPMIELRGEHELIHRYVPIDVCQVCDEIPVPNTLYRPIPASGTTLLYYIAQVLEAWDVYTDPTALVYNVGIVRTINKKISGLKIYTTHEWNGRRFPHTVEGMTRLKVGDKLCERPLEGRYPSLLNYLRDTYKIIVKYMNIPLIEVRGELLDHKKYLPVELCYVRMGKNRPTGALF